LDDAANTVTELALRLPSLADVFRSRTGHRAQAAAEPVAETVSGRA
jgi:hypothetical protein